MVWFTLWSIVKQFSLQRGRCISLWHAWKISSLSHNLWHMWGRGQERDQPEISCTLLISWMNPHTTTSNITIQLQILLWKKWCLNIIQESQHYFNLNRVITKLFDLKFSRMSNRKFHYYHPSISCNARKARIHHQLQSEIISSMNLHRWKYEKNKMIVFSQRL